MRAPILFFALTLVIASSFVFADPVIQTSFNISPAVPSPGNDGYIQVNLKNSGGNAATNVKITITNEDPGIIITGQRSVDIGGVGIGETVSSLFKFSVASNVQSGQYKVGFNIYSCHSGCITSLQYAIITVRSPSLLEITSLSPATIDIGKQTNLTLTMVNNGNDNIDNIILTWSEPNNKILPLGSDNRIIVPSIGAKQSLKIPLTVITSSDITAGIKYLNFISEYSDKTGSTQKINHTVGLLVGGKTDFDINFQEFDKGTFSLSIANVGLNPVKSVSIRIPEQDGVFVVNAKNIFLGDLNPGDFSTANFKLIPAALSKSNLNLIVELTYTDNSGIRQMEESDITINLQSSELQSYFKSSTDISPIVIIAILLGIGGFLYWKYLKRKKK